MVTKYPTGNIVAVVTPFIGQDCDVDAHAMRQHAAFIFNSGHAKSIVVGGYNGEGNTISEPQFNQLLHTASTIKQLYPGNNLYVGLMPQTANHAQQRIHSINQHNLDGILLSPPLAQTLSTHLDVVNYFHSLADYTSLPIIAYNTKKSPTQLAGEDMYTLKQKLGEKFIGVKNSGASDLRAQLFTLAKTSGLPFMYIEGDDRRIYHSTYSLKKMTENGSYALPIANISGSSNFSEFAKVIGQIYHYIERSSFGEALLAQDSLDIKLALSLRNALQFGGEAPIWKALARNDGINMELSVLPPLSPVDEKEIARLERDLFHKHSRQ